MMEGTNFPRSEAARAVRPKCGLPPGPHDKFAAADLLKTSIGNRCQVWCDKASPAAAVVLHLRSCYVSKAAILTVPVRAYRSKIEVPLEFQGLGPLGAASWRRFFPCEFDS